MNIHRLTISKVVNGGFGLGRLTDGRTAMVRQALPGETVDVRIDREYASYLEGAAITIHARHPQRVEPPCPVYGSCGGCNLQHGDYRCQLALKKEIILDLLQRHGASAVRQAAGILADPLPSPSTFGYRQRIRLQIDAGGQLGFRRFHSHTIIPVSACLLARDEINRTIAALRGREAFTALARQVSELEIMVDPARNTTVCIVTMTRPPRPRDFSQAAQLCKESTVIDRIFFQGEGFQLVPAAGKETESNRQADRMLAVTYPATQIHPPLALSWEVGGFCQVNLEQNLTLIATVMNFAAITPEDTVLDLFCGMGNFSIPLAGQCRSLLGIEGQAAAIRSAGINAARARLDNVEFRRSPIHAACEDLAAKGSVFTCTVIDPPRQGAPGLATLLASMTSHRLVYISCDPATLCRDLGDLVAAGFSLKRLQPIDMFPQTHHIETVALLEKN